MYRFLNKTISNKAFTPLSDPERDTHGNFLKNVLPHKLKAIGKTLMTSFLIHSNIRLKSRNRPILLLVF